MRKVDEVVFTGGTPGQEVELAIEGCVITGVTVFNTIDDGPNFGCENVPVHFATLDYESLKKFRDDISVLFKKYGIKNIGGGSVKVDERGNVSITDCVITGSDSK